MITLYFANVGSGKSTKLAQIASKELKKIRKGKSKYKYVVSNCHIKGVYYVPDIHIIAEKAFENCLILIDEGSIEFNSRNYKSMKPQEVQYFKLHRHYGGYDPIDKINYSNDIVIVSQSYEDIDITIRRLYGQMYILKKLGPFTAEREIKKYITIDENEQIIEGYRFVRLPRFWLRKPYYKYFDSYWRPENVPVVKVDEELEQLEPYKPKSLKEKILDFKIKVIEKLERFRQNRKKENRLINFIKKDY